MNAVKALVLAILAITGLMFLIARSDRLWSWFDQYQGLVALGLSLICIVALFIKFKLHPS